MCAVAHGGILGVVTPVHANASLDFVQMIARSGSALPLQINSARGCSWLLRSNAAHTKKLSLLRMAAFRAEWICPTFGDVVSPRSGPAPWLTTPYVASLRVPKGMDCSVRCRARRHPWRCDPSPRKRFARLRSNDRVDWGRHSASNPLIPFKEKAIRHRRMAFSLVGLSGFEPPISWSRTKRASPCATARN